MSRTPEKVLGIISAIFTAFGILISIAIMAFFNFMQNDPTIRGEFEAELYATPELSPADIEAALTMLNLVGGFMWFGIALLVVSLILNIVGLTKIWKNKNAKLAGILFIVAGLLGGIVSLPSILLYIAGILCLTKKPPLLDEPVYVDDSHDGTMRPL